MVYLLLGNSQLWFKPSYRTDSYGKKTLLLWVLLIARIKHETFWGICQLNRSTQIKLKLFSLKDALTNTNNGP